MSKSSKPARGTYVSRSVYQKVVEENNKLKQDIWLMVMRPVSGAALLIRDKWKKKFEDDNELRQLLHDFAVQYVKDNPDSVVAKIAREFPPKLINRCVECGCAIAENEKYCAECLCEDDCDPFV